MRKILKLVSLFLLSYVIVCFVWAFLMTFVVIVDISTRMEFGEIVVSLVMSWFMALGSGGIIWEMSLDPKLLWLFDILCVLFSTIFLLLLYKSLVPKLNLRYLGILAFGVSISLLFYINTIKPAPSHNGEGSFYAVGRSIEGGIFPHWVWLGE